MGGPRCSSIGNCKVSERSQQHVHFFSRDKGPDDIGCIVIFVGGTWAEGGVMDREKSVELLEEFLQGRWRDC